MRRLKLLVSGLIAGVIFSANVCALASSSPVGYWKTIDDVSGKPRSIVQIWRTADNDALMGKVVKIFPTNKVGFNKRCTACSGDKHNQLVVGMVIMSGLKTLKNRWGNGKILDPDSGKTYNCLLKLGDNGKKLDVQGYRGFSILGRSQTWERVDLMSAV
jgi:uncharacterized protein (DUF2147 family)